MVEKLALVLAPFAPYLSQEIWEELGREGPVFRQPWPAFDPELAKDDEAEIVVQVNGKLRGSLDVARDTAEDEIRKQALAVSNVVKHLEGKTVRKVIVVPGRIVNIVVG